MTPTDRKSAGAHYLFTAEQIYNIAISPLRTTEKSLSGFLYRISNSPAHPGALL